MDVASLGALLGAAWYAGGGAFGIIGTILGGGPEDWAVLPAPQQQDHNGDRCYGNGYSLAYNAASRMYTPDAFIAKC